MKNLAFLVALAATNVFAQDAPASATSTIISVRDCGAKGDGVADDSGAFQKAFEQAVRADHAVVRIPAGAYRLNRQVSVQFKGAVGNGLTVAGDGQGVSVIHCANTNCREAGVRLRNRKFFHITNCLFYAQTEDQLAYTDIAIANCWAGQITGNTFNGKGVAIRVEPGAMGVQTLNNQLINPHVVAK